MSLKTGNFGVVGSVGSVSKGLFVKVMESASVSESLDPLDCDDEDVSLVLLGLDRDLLLGFEFWLLRILLT